MKKVISYLITAMMVFTMIPSIAFAGTADNQQTSQNLCLHIEQSNPLYGGDSEPVVEIVESVSELAAVDGIAPNTSAEAAYVESAEAAAAILREKMIARQTTVTIEMPVTEADLTAAAMKTLTSGIFTAAMEHTGKVNEGDSLQWVWKEQRTSISVTGNANGLIAAITYTIDYYTTAEQEAELTAAVETLKTELDLDDKSDYEIVKVIYDYMTANIKYDYTNYSDDSYVLKWSAYAALINKTSVCQGYATLFYRMMCEYGIDARLVAGSSINAKGQPEAHSWNIVKLGSKYYNLDATWDSTYDQNTSVHDFFLKGTENFTNHTLDAQFTTDEFTSAYPMSEADYVPGADDEQGGSDKPDTPADPENPEDPEVPGDPENPEDPEVPGDPVDPEDPGVCVHNETEVIPAVAATCKTTGLTEGLKCAICDEVITPQEETPIADHIYDDGVVITEPNTIKEGYKQFVCIVCGTGKVEKIPMLGEVRENWANHAAEAFSGGDGSVNNPYLISNGSELALLANLVAEENSPYSTAYYKLTNDIDLEAHEWSSIGEAYRVSNIFYYAYGFKGYFDGANYTIRNIKMSEDNTYDGNFYHGLFAWNEGIIKNLNVENINYKMTNNASYVGGIAAFCNGGVIENCSVSGNIIADDDIGDIGGVAGRLCEAAVVRNCSSSINIQGGEHAGGITGYNEDSTIDTCYFNGKIAASYYTGGIAGSASSFEEENAYINNCISNGTVTGTKYIGGILGVSHISVIMMNNLNMSTVTGENMVGGVIGATGSYYENSDNCTEIIKCMNVGSVSGTENTGEIIGQLFINGNTSREYIQNVLYTKNPWYGNIDMQPYDSGTVDALIENREGKIIQLSNCKRDKINETWIDDNWEQLNTYYVLKDSYFDKYESEYLNEVVIKDHEYEWIIDQQATEEQTGIKHEECTLCAEKRNENTVIPKLDCTHSIVKVFAVESTCTNDGNIEHYTCTKCGKLYSDEVAQLQISEADVVITAPGHDYINHAAQKATCTESGWEAYETCSRCDYTTYNESGPTGHSWDAKWKVTTRATLKSSGKETKYCANCDKTQTRNIARVKSISRTYATLVYNGGRRTPVTVKDVNGKTLKSGTDYKVQYLTSCKNVGAHKLKVVLIGKYKGEKTITFTINPKATTISKLTTPAKKQIKVTWAKKTVQVTGYQIRYSTKKSMSKAKTLKVASYKTNTKTIKSLKSKQRYYVQIRTYKTVSGKTYYSAWSKANTIKTR